MYSVAIYGYMPQYKALCQDLKIWHFIRYKLVDVPVTTFKNSDKLLEKTHLY